MFKELLAGVALLATGVTADASLIKLTGLNTITSYSVTNMSSWDEGVSNKALGYGKVYVIEKEGRVVYNRESVETYELNFVFYAVDSFDNDRGYVKVLWQPDGYMEQWVYTSYAIEEVLLGLSRNYYRKYTMEATYNGVDVTSLGDETIVSFSNVESTPWKSNTYFFEEVSKGFNPGVITVNNVPSPSSELLFLLGLLALVAVVAYQRNK